MEAVKKTSTTVLLLLLASIMTVTGRGTHYVRRSTAGTTDYGDGHGGLSEDLQSIRELMDKRFDRLQSIIAAEIDYFGKRLDGLDTKLDKLETSVLGQLNIISENVINYKVQNDITTENNRPYEEFDRKLESIEGKLQLVLGQIEGTTESIAKRLEKLEMQTKERDTNLEAEISYVIGSLEVVKRQQTTFDSKLGNTSSLLNMTKHTQKLLIHFHTDEKKHMNKLHDNIISSLLYLDNKTTEHFMVSEANNHLLVPLKKELKEDFNSYANKVADMTSDLGSSTLKLREAFRGLESQVNGLDRNLKTLIGRVGIGGSPNGSIVCEDDKIQEVLRSKFQKVLANQEEFMKGCYKVQMQEPQIEGEISAMLEKLLDMLVKRFGENDRDARVFKHMIKNHHEQTQRNLVQLNENIASVYGRSTASIHEIEQVIRDVQENVKALYTYLKGVLPEGREQHLKVILDKLQKIEEYTKRFKGCPDHVKPELKKIQNTLTSMMKVIAVERPKSRDADTVKAVQTVFGTGNSSSNTSTTTLPWDPTKINIRGDLASNGHDAKNDTRNPSNSDNDTTEGGTSGPFPDSTTVPYTDNQSKTTVVQTLLSVQNSTKSSDLAPKMAVGPVRNLLTENSASQNGTTVSPAGNKGEAIVVSLQNSTKPSNDSSVVLLQHALKGNTSQNGTTVPSAVNGNGSTVVENAVQSASTENTETSQSDNRVPPIDNNSKATVVEKIGALLNETQPLDAAPENTVAPLQSELTGSTEASRSDTTVPPIDNSKATVVEKVGAMQNGTQPLDAAPENTVTPLQSGLTGSTEASQNDTTVPPIDNNSKATVVEKVGALQNGTQPLDAAPENTVVPLQSGLTGNTETSQSDTTVPPIDNSKATVVEKVGALQHGTKPSNAGPENTVAPLQSRLTGNTETLQSETTVPPVDNNSKTRSLQNTTNPSNDVPEATVALLQNVSTVSSNVETRKTPETTIALASGITVPSNDKPGTTTKTPENSSAVLPKNEPANDEPEKNEIASKNISIASTTPLPKRLHIRPSDSNSEFAYRKLPEPDYEDVEIAV